MSIIGALFELSFMQLLSHIVVISKTMQDNAVIPIISIFSSVSSENCSVTLFSGSFGFVIILGVIPMTCITRGDMFLILN